MFISITYRLDPPRTSGEPSSGSGGVSYRWSLLISFPQSLWYVCFRWEKELFKVRSGFTTDTCKSMGSAVSLPGFNGFSWFMWSVVECKLAVDKLSHLGLLVSAAKLLLKYKESMVLKALCSSLNEIQSGYVVQRMEHRPCSDSTSICAQNRVHRNDDVILRHIR